MDMALSIVYQEVYVGSVGFVWMQGRGQVVVLDSTPYVSAPNKILKKLLEKAWAINIYYMLLMYLRRHLDLN